MAIASDKKKKKFAPPKVDRTELEKVRDRLREQSKRSGGDKDYLTLEEGDTVIRVLPGHPNMDSFYSVVHYHRKSFGKKGDISVPCVNNGESDGDCPICEELASIARSKDKSDRDIYHSRKAKPRFFINVLHRGAEDPTKVYILGCGATIFEPILSHIIEEEEYGDVLDVNEGCDFKIHREGTGLETEYSVQIRPKPKPISEDPDEIIGTSEDDTKLNDLSQIGQVNDMEDLMVAWETGKWPENDDKKSSKKSKSKSSRDEDEDEEEEEEKPKKKSKPARDEEEEDEEEEPRPKAKKKPKPQPEEDEDEEEEEPKPKAKAKPKAKPEPEDEDEDEDDEPAPKAKSKSKPKPKADEDEDEDDGLDELEAAIQRGKTKGKK